MHRDVAAESSSVIIGKVLRRGASPSAWSLLICTFVCIAPIMLTKAQAGYVLTLRVA
jgi:hypothetical protein